MRKILNVVLTLIFITLLPILSSCDPGSMDFYIFEDISECENIRLLEYGNAEITQYDTPEKDEYSKGLSYDEFFAAKYKSDSLEFEIFAYHFDNSDESQQYFKNVTGKDDGLSTNFLVSSGIGFGTRLSKIVVIDYDRAYIVFTPHSQLEEMKQALGKIFSSQLDF